MGSPEIEPKVDDASAMEKGKEDDASPASSDSELVTWDGPLDPSDPQNWPQWRKWFITLLMSLCGLVTLMSGAMIAPALKAISNDLHISQTAASMALSIFLLSFAFGPMILAPCSEIFGRKYVWLAGSVWYIIWNLLCGFAKNDGLMYAGRFLSGIGASVEFAVTTPIMADVWRAEERGKGNAIRGVVPLLGPALGPILGGVITDQASWPWIFWTTSIFDAVMVILALFVLPETYAPVLLSRKAAKLRKETGRRYHTQAELNQKSLRDRLKLALIRPYRMLFTNPTIQIISLYQAWTFGLVYLVLSSFSTLWTTTYHQTPTISALHYLSIVLGYTTATIIGGPLTDLIWKRLTAKHAGVTAPEYRIPLMLPPAILIPAGFLWYGWSAEKRLVWIMPDIGMFLWGCGYIFGVQGTTTYIIEAFLEYTASATAATSLLRNVAAFAFPIFAPVMYERLGYGWGNTLMAGLSAAIVIPVPLVLWRFGARIRKRGVVV